jgi:hypothetical protein
MKVSSSDDDTIIIQCERFEAGREPFSLLVPTSIEIVYLFLFLAIIYFSGFDWLNFLSEILSTIIAYGENHHVEIIVYVFTFTILIIGNVNDLLFKKVFVRAENVYRIDRNYCILPRPSYNYHQGMIIPDEDIVDVIDSIDIKGANNISVRVSSYYDDDIKGFPVAVETAYKVIVKLKSGELSTIESNSLGVGSCDENQIAFRELMAETQASVEKIKSFLVSSNQ